MPFQPHNATAEAVIAQEERARFFNFVRNVILPFEPQAFVAHSPFHRSLMLTATLTKSATAAPRGMLKSTIFSRYRVLHRLVEPAFDTIPPEEMIVSETTSLSTDHLAWIKKHLQDNHYLQDKYGSLINPSQLTWNEDEVELTSGAKCYALGYGSQVRGKHPTGIVVDDLESERNVSTDDSLKKVKDWFYRVIMGAMLPETHLSVIGTIIRSNSLLHELIQREGFDGKIWKALIQHPDGTHRSVWPERWPVDLLLRKRRDLGRHRFEAEFQNNPIGPGDVIIELEWIRRHSPDHLATFTPVRRYIAVDPAYTEERWGNSSAIVILDEAPNGMLFERLAWKKKVTEPDLIRMIMAVYQQFQGPEIFLGVEKVAGQKGIIQHIRELNPTIQIIPLIADKDKTRRLIDVSRYFEMGLVSLMTQGLVDDVLSAPIGEMDRVDALVYDLKLYEQQHPILADSSFSDLSHMPEQMNDLDQHNYMERWAEGLPGYEPPKQVKQNYIEAMIVQELLDEFM